MRADMERMNQEQERSLFGEWPEDRDIPVLAAPPLDERCHERGTDIRNHPAEAKTSDKPLPSDYIARASCLFCKQSLEVIPPGGLFRRHVGAQFPYGECETARQSRERQSNRTERRKEIEITKKETITRDVEAVGVESVSVVRECGQCGRQFTAYFSHEIPLEWRRRYIVPACGLCGEPPEGFISHVLEPDRKENPS
jgi:hypothetical protein